VAELWPEQVFQWRARVCTMWLTADQIDWAMRCFSAMPDRVEVLVAAWCRCVDLANIWRALYNLSVRPPRCTSCQPSSVVEDGLGSLRTLARSALLGCITQWPVLQNARSTTHARAGHVLCTLNRQ
jgi:hypothetical protein